MLTTGQTHEKPHRAESRRGGVVCGVLLSVFLLAAPIQLNAQHVERGGWRDYTLPKLLDAPGALVAAMGSKVCPTPAELLECGCESWAVVHHIPAIGKDDGDAVGAAAVVAGDSHGSGLWVVAFDGDVAVLEIVFVAGKFRWHSFAAPAIAGASELAGSGFGDGNVVSGFLAFVKTVWSLETFDSLAAGKGGADIVGLVAVESVQCEFNDLGNWLCGGGHLVWSVALAFVAQLRSIYTFSVYAQEKSTLFSCSPKTRLFSPLNA